MGLLARPSTPMELPKGYGLRRLRLTLQAFGGAAATVTVASMASTLLLPMLPLLPLAYAITELAFSVVFVRKRRALNALKSVRPDPQRALEAFHKVMDAVMTLDQAEGPDAWLYGWFRFTPQATAQTSAEADLGSRGDCYSQGQGDLLGRDNVLDLLSEAFFAVTREQLETDTELKAQLELMCSEMEATLPTPFLPGRNPCAQLLQHLPAQLPTNYRPFAFYACIEFMALMNDNMLRAAGFTKHVLPEGSVYFTRKCPAASAASQLPEAPPAGSEEQPLLGSPASPMGHPNGSQAQLCSRLANGGSRSCSDDGRRSNSGDSVRSYSSTCSSSSSGRSSSNGSIADMIASIDSSGGNTDGSLGTDGMQAEEALLPIVLTHGVGMGLLPYLGVLVSLAATGRPVIAMEYPHTGQRWSSADVPSTQRLAEAVLSAMDAHGFKRAAMIGHSFGTAVLSRVLQTAPRRVATLALMDPVVFNMFLPTLLRGFLYRSFSTLSKAPKDCLLIGAAKEMHCAATVCRRLDWASVNLFAEMVPEGTLVALSGKDELLPAASMATWLRTNTRATVLYNAHLTHAAVLLDLKAIDTVIHHVLHASGQTCNSPAPGCKQRVPNYSGKGEGGQLPSDALAPLEGVPQPPQQQQQQQCHALSRVREQQRCSFELPTAQLLRAQTQKRSLDLDLDLNLLQQQTLSKHVPPTSHLDSPPSPLQSYSLSPSVMTSDSDEECCEDV